ncbi:MAG: helix-turn-helix transcriptional regulator [bacterium]|nr:helix-turn-helix transcriptional regulator [bacterium]
MTVRKKTGRKKPMTKKGQKKKAAGARKKSTRAAKARRAAPRNKPASLGERVTELVEQVAAGAFRTAVDVGGAGLAALLPETDEMRRETGAYVRELRELAGLTRDELAEALEVSDRSLLEAVEAGTSTLSFELTLRLAAILARHDPLPVVFRLMRTYNPVLSQLLEDWGIDELPLQVEREREFVNILRGADEARSLSDEDFDQVLAFTRSAFETALHFATK